MKHTHHFRLCPPPSSLSDNKQPVRQISQHVFNSFFSSFKTFLVPLTLKDKFQAFIFLKNSHPSPGNWASDIRLVTKVFVSNIIFRTDQHPAGAIRTTRNWKKIIRRKAFTIDLTGCLQNIWFSLKQHHFQHSPSPCIYESALIEKTKDWVQLHVPPWEQGRWNAGIWKDAVSDKLLRFYPSWLIIV